MDEWWERFTASGKVSDYLAYCKMAEEESHAVSYTHLTLPTIA